MKNQLAEAKKIGTMTIKDAFLPIHGNQLKLMRPIITHLFKAGWIYTKDTKEIISVTILKKYLNVPMNDKVVGFE